MRASPVHVWLLYLTVGLLAPAAWGAPPARTKAAKKHLFQVRVRAAETRREVVERVLSAAELSRIPGTQNDALRGVQNLPGVARSPFGIGQLVVWGSAPGDTRVYADGVLIPRLYHFGGIRSTLNTEFIADLTFVPGAYSADFGGGLGGLIDVRTKLPPADRLHGSVTLDLIDGSLTLSGPVTERLQVAAGARVSWISAFLPLLTGGGPRLSPFYWDYQLAARYRMSAADDVDLLVFGSTSDIRAQVDDPDPAVAVDIRSKSYFSRARARFTHRFPGGGVFTLTPSFGADAFSLETGAAGVGGQQLRSEVLQFGYQLRAELRRRLHPLLEVQGGLDLLGSRAAVDALSPLSQGTSGEGQGIPVGSGGMIRDAGRAEGAFLGDNLFADGNGQAVQERAVIDMVQIAPYLVTRCELFDRRLLLSPQLRVPVDHLRVGEGAAPRTRVSAEPRLLARLRLFRRVYLKAALGLYHQVPQGAELAVRFGNPGLSLETGATYVLGAEADLTDTLHAEMQGFYKDLRALVVADPQARYSNEGLGRAYGGELLLRQQLWHNLFGWLAYTLSRSERRDHPFTDAAAPWHLFRFDQTHILTLVVSYRLPRGFEIGLRFRYVTGNPTTPRGGALRSIPAQGYVPIYGAPWTTRLPDFHQLDLRIDKTFSFRRWRLGIYLDLQNVYNQQNTENLVYGGRQLYQEARVASLPFFPNLGLRADF